MASPLSFTPNAQVQASHGVNIRFRNCFDYGGLRGVKAGTHSNYGNVLTIYDRILGTFTSRDRAETVVYGLDEVDWARIGSFGGLLSMPFQQEVQPS